MPDGIRARWHIIDVDDRDPFEAVPALGPQLDLTAPTAELEAQLRALMEREGRLESMGQVCELKDAGQDCGICIHASARHFTHWALCEVGREEAAISQECVARARSAQGPVPEIAALASQCSAMGHLDKALYPMLAQAGL